MDLEVSVFDLGLLRRGGRTKLENTMSSCYHHDLTIDAILDYEATEKRLSNWIPGMAFGTGTHPTTKMSSLPRSGSSWWQKRLLSVGTSSRCLYRQLARC